MKFILGLGNPGREYEGTLHNLGFKAVEAIASTNDISFSFKKRVPGYAGRGKIEAEEVLLVKPSTFVNESGRAARYLLDYHDALSSDLIVICDDLDLKLGKIRIREKGSSGGHKGLASIIEEVGSSDFPRVRIGIGRPPPGNDAVDYVLRPPRKDSGAVLKMAVSLVAEAIATILKEGILAAMNIYNGKDVNDEEK